MKIDNQMTLLICRGLMGRRDDILLAVFRQIASGLEEHGSFLTSFAKAIILADRENLILLRSVAWELVEKYALPDQPFETDIQ